jgi:hypothetical protein
MSKRTIKIIACIACYLIGFALIWNSKNGSIGKVSGWVLSAGFGSFLFISIKRDFIR